MLQIEPAQGMKIAIKSEIQRAGLGWAMIRNGMINEGGHWNEKYMSWEK